MTAFSVVKGLDVIENAEACFNEALATSRAQGAKSLELRAAISMARLWEGQGRRSDARNLLDSAFRGIPEWRDTPDMVEANAVLRDLE